MQQEFSKNTGLMFADSEMSEQSETITLNQLTSSAVASLAKTFQTSASGQESRANGQDCGVNTSDLLASYDPDTCLWKTSQHSLFGGLGEFSETWPRAGTMRNGSAYQRPPLVPRISATGFGYLPTPDASLGTFKPNTMMDVTSCYRKALTGKRPSGATIGSSLRWCPEFIRERLRTGGELNPEWIEVLMGLPLGWTDLGHSETQSSHRSQSGLDAE